MLLLTFVACVYARTVRVGVGLDYEDLTTAITMCRPGDVVQLTEPFVDLHSTLVVEQSVTIETAPDVVSSIIRATSPSTDVVVAINANDVTLRNVIFGASANDRAIDVFVSSGTQQHQSSLFSTTSGGSQGKGVESTRAVSQELLDRDGQPQKLTSNRAIRNFVLENVDFSASRSATNVAFDTGAYIGVSITRCKFGQHDLTEAIVTVDGAMFADTAPIEFNAFSGARLSLFSHSFDAAFGTNYWSSSSRPLALSRTYCVDAHCTLLGPVVDADRATQAAYANVAAALNAGVQNVLITAASVEFGKLNDPIKLSGTTIRGRRPEECTANDALPLVRVTDPVESLGSALVAMSDLRFEIDEKLTQAFAYSDGTEQGDVLIERVFFFAESAAQTVLQFKSKSVAATLHACTFIHGATAVWLGGGALVISDSHFVAQRAASILVAGSGSGTGLRVSGSEFIGSPHGSIVFADAVESSRMLPISVSCSRFVFAPFFEPHDCMRNAQQCANALRYNTFIEVIKPTAQIANRRFLAHGNNHVERVAESQIGEFTQMQTEGGATFAFSFADKQGRFGTVRADVALLQKAANQFVMASNVPMRQECFAETVPGQRVVSGLFSLTTDAPSSCVSLALQFTVINDDRDNTTVASGDDVAVYDVQHLGNNVRGSAIWQRAASNMVLNKAASNMVVEASSGSGALLQAVVVAQTLTDKESAVLLSNGESVGAPRANQRFCVACGSDRIPAYVLDERCGGGTGDHVFTDFDQALTAANEAGKADSVVLLVYGKSCTLAQCNTRITASQFTLEGFSVSAQSTLTRSAQCPPATPMLTVAAPSVTVRYMMLTTDTPLTSAVPRCALQLAQNDARVSFSTINGGVCADDADAQIVGNEIVASALSLTAVVASGQSSNTLIQSNVIKNGDVVIEVNARSVRVDRNTFGATAGVVNSASVVLSGNTFTDRAADRPESAACVTALEETTQFTSTSDMFGARCQLLLAGSGKIRVTGKKSASPWVNVLTKLSDTTDVRIANVDLLGSDSQVLLLDAGAKGVVLYDVGIDLEQSTLQDTLLGRALGRTPCSASDEPALGGFALGESLLLDVKTRQLLIGGSVPRLKATDFISPTDGRIQKCAQTPEASYCRCMAAQGVPLTTTSRPTEKPTTAVDPVVIDSAKPQVRVLPTEPLLEEEPLDDFDAQLDAALPVTLARIVKSLPRPAARFAILAASSSSDDFRDGRNRTGWIVGGILLAVAIVVIICVLCCFCYPGYSSSTTTRRVVEEGDDGSEVVRETTVVSNAPRRAKTPTRPSMGVVLSPESSESSVSGAKLTKRVNRNAGAENV
jgi:hypothetical protein